MDNIAKHLFERLGINANVYRSTQKRSVRDLNLGHIDGIVVSARQAFPNITTGIPISEPIIQGDFVALIRKSGSISPKLESLKTRRISFRDGTSILEKIFASHKSVIKVHREGQFLRLLELNRIDVAIAEKRIAQKLLTDRKAAEFKILKPPVISVKGFFIIHKKHRHLLPSLEKALKAMKRDGTYLQVMSQKTKPQKNG